MATTIQVKRSLNTATPSSLANGEFAYSANGDVLFIGSNAAIVAIGGKRVPGTLTANQAMVTNSTSYMDVVKTANLFIQSVSVNVINTVANSTVLGAPSNSEITSTWAIKTYVDGKVAGAAGAPGGANTQIQFNDSSSFSGTAGFTYDKTTNNVLLANTLFVGNSTVNAIVNSTIHLIQNSTATANLSLVGLVIGTSTVNSTAHVAGANVFLDTVKLSIGNSTVNATANSLLFTVQNATGIANLTPISLIIGSATVNSTAHIAGANLFFDTVKFSAGNTTANLIANSISVVVANSTGTATLNPTTLTVGNLGGTQINTAANLAFTSANVYMASAIVSAQDLILSGNLTVSGTLTTIDATNLQVADPLIKLSRSQSTADALSIGLYGEYGNSTVIQYSGFFRDQANASVWTLFNTQKEPTTTVDTANNTYTIGTLFSRLASYGLVSNGTNLNLTANSTLAVALVANTLSLSTALPGTSGGTGRGTATDQDILVANTTNGWNLLNKGADGNVLQVSGTTLVWGMLDGGSF